MDFKEELEAKAGKTVSVRTKKNEPVTMAFIAALMNAAQLGLEPNTPLGQAYLIPFKNKKKGVLEWQFQIGYKGMIDLVYRNGNVQTIQTQVVYENDLFQDKKYLLQLYKALHPEDCDVTEDEIADVTIKHDYFKRTNQNLYGSKKSKYSQT